MEANIKEVGSFGAKASLYGPDGDHIATASQTANIEATGAHVFTLTVSGGVLGDQKIDGPYTVKNIVLMDMTNSAVQSDFAADGPSTETVKYDKFIMGLINMDKELYSTALEKMTITVTDTRANLDQEQAEFLTITLETTADLSTAQTFQLKETGVNTGVFTNKIGFSLESSDSGVVKVDNGAVITASYADPETDYVWKASGIWKKSMVFTSATGWNLLSFPYDPDPSTISEILDEGMDSTVFLWKWENNTWAVAIPSLSSEDETAYIQAKGFTALTDLKAGEGYWLNASGEFTMDVAGLPGETQSLVLSSGWNLVGLKKPEPVQVADLISGNKQSIISVWKWQTNAWAVYLPDQEGGGAAYAQSKGFDLLEEIKPGDGFWINANGAVTLD